MALGITVVIPKILPLIQCHVGSNTWWGFGRFRRITTFPPAHYVLRWINSYFSQIKLQKIWAQLMRRLTEFTILLPQQYIATATQKNDTLPLLPTWKQYIQTNKHQCFFNIHIHYVRNLQNLLRSPSKSDLFLRDFVIRTMKKVPFSSPPTTAAIIDSPYELHKHKSMHLSAKLKELKTFSSFTSTFFSDEATGDEEWK